MRKKLLLMGKSGSGKTSMRSIIFANYIARDTRRLGATIDVEHSQIRLLGNLVLHLWDCGGQEGFMDNYLQSQRGHIFKNVQVLIYVFDVESKDFEQDIEYYESVLEAIRQYSKDAKIFVLIHKFDLIELGMIEKTFNEKALYIKNLTAPCNVTCFATSIWDETLYKAWSAIVFALVPNVRAFEETLQDFASVLNADEVVLFERSTFLRISNVIVRPHDDLHRYEKISNIIKQFRLSCGKAQSQMQSLEIKEEAFSLVIEPLTSNIFVMIVVSNNPIYTAIGNGGLLNPSKDEISDTNCCLIKCSLPAIQINIRLARPQFESLEQQ